MRKIHSPSSYSFERTFRGGTGYGRPRPAQTRVAYRRAPCGPKRNLAASILMLAGYTGEETLLDPMCGSGTLAIEGAYIALNKAPLIHRGKDDFALEHLASFDSRTLWRRVSGSFFGLPNETSCPLRSMRRIFGLSL